MPSPYNMAYSCTSVCSWPAVLPGCVLCSCLRCACLCAHLWGGKRSFAREEPMCVCPMQTLHRRGCLGTKSGTVRAHFGRMTSIIIYGLSGALFVDPSYITGVFKSR